MLPTDRLHAFAGVVLLLLALGIVITTVCSIAVTDADPFSKSDVSKMLVDIKDHDTVHAIGLVSSVVVDSVLSIAAAAVLFRFFRSRNQTLATLGLVFILAGAVCFIVNDGGTAVMGTLASDFKNGGAGKLGARSDTTLEIAHVISIFTGVIGQMGATALSMGLLSFGVIMLGAEAGAAAMPPRWLGWGAVVAGIAGVLAWFTIVIDVAFVFFILSGIASLIWIIGLGLWFLRTPQASDVMEPAATPA